MTKITRPTKRNAMILAIAAALALIAAFTARVIADDVDERQTAAAAENVPASRLPDLHDVDWAIREGERWLRH